MEAIGRPSFQHDTEKYSGLEQGKGKVTRKEKEPLSAVKQIAFEDTQESLAPGE